jgi:hypothetical protein
MIVISNKLQVAQGREKDFEERFQGRAPHYSAGNPGILLDAGGTPGDAAGRGGTVRDAGGRSGARS